MGADPKRNRRLDDDERAMLEALLREAGPRVAAYVRRAYGHVVDVEEVVAETFARAAARIESLRTCGRQDLYLIKIARNLCLDGFRRHKPESASQEFISSRPSALPPPGLQAERAEREQMVRDAVARLPEPQREIVVLRTSAGLKFEEIAKLLDIPIGTALSRMHAALGRLRERLEHTCDG